MTIGEDIKGHNDIENIKNSQMLLLSKQAKKQRLKEYFQNLEILQLYLLSFLVPRQLQHQK
jgi:hypothetical protein